MNIINNNRGVGMSDYDKGFTDGIEAVLLIVDSEEGLSMAHLRTRILELREKFIRRTLAPMLRLELGFEV